MKSTGFALIPWVRDFVKKTTKKSQSYSTEETKTGGYWIDGKPIYRKVLSGLNMSAGTIDVSSLNIDRLVRLDGYISSGQLLITCCTDKSANRWLYLLSNGTQLDFHIENSTNKLEEVLLEYTKTTDTATV